MRDAAGFASAALGLGLQLCCRCGCGINVGMSVSMCESVYLSQGLSRARVRLLLA